METFGDRYMNKIAIRLDAGKSIGMGHFVRCTALAKALTGIKHYKIYFICRNRLNIRSQFPVLYLGKEYKTLPDSYNFPSILDEVPEMERIISENGIDCLIVDHYGAKDDYFYALRKKVKFLVCIDDSLQRSIPVDVIVNGNVYGSDAYYAKIPLKLLGGQYMLLRPEFYGSREKEIKPEVKKIYVTSGGADPLGFCSIVSDALLAHFPQLEVHVIVGSDFKWEYMKELNKKRIILHQNACMKQCMIDADFFITSAGSTLYELAVCGVPSISYVLGADQELVADYLHRLGTTWVCGSFQQYNEKEFIDLCGAFFLNINKRESMSRLGQRNIGASGAKNVAEKLQEQFKIQEGH